MLLIISTSSGWPGFCDVGSSSGTYWRVGEKIQGLGRPGIQFWEDASHEVKTVGLYEYGIQSKAVGWTNTFGSHQHGEGLAAMGVDETPSGDTGAWDPYELEASQVRQRMRKWKRLEGQRGRGKSRVFAPKPREWVFQGRGCGQPYQMPWVRQGA